MVASVMGNIVSESVIEKSRDTWYVQAARLEAGSWLTERLGSEDVLLSSDLGALSWKLANVDCLDLNGLTSEAVLGAVIRGAPTHTGLPNRPTILVDTGDSAGRTVAEEIWDHPSDFFEADQLHPDCLFSEVYDEKLMGRWPSNENLEHYV